MKKLLRFAFAVIVANIAGHRSTGRANGWWVRYNAYLKSPEWKAQHDRVIARDGHKCTRCGSDKQLQAHHVSYWNYNRTGHTLDRDLITLCNSCHKKAHNK
jgi:5-methylcytosine-specific restriction endonuclease McrA